MYQLFVYVLDTGSHVATITGSTEQCEKLAQEKYDNEIYGATYSPAFGYVNGLNKFNRDAIQLVA